MNSQEKRIAVQTKGTLVLSEIDKLLGELTSVELNFSQLRIKIGNLLNEVRVNSYWRESFQSFDEYMESIENKFNRKRTQLYAYAGLVRDLLPEVGAERLGEMGLEKAKLLQQSKKTTGHLPGESVLDAAADEKVSVKDFRQMLLDGKKLPDTPMDGKHYSIEYFAIPDQQKTIQDALLSAKRTSDAAGTEEMKTGVGLEVLGMSFLVEYPLESSETKSGLD